jgi:hypothetical protein
MNSGIASESRGWRSLDTDFARAAFGAGFSLAAPDARNSAALPLFEFQIPSGGA